MRNLSKTIVSEKATLIQKEIIMDSIFWLITALVLFIIALILDEELRAEMKDIRTASAAVFIMIALYYSIMWIVKEWLQWCL